MNIVILGLSVTSSWGNGHATTYRSLIRGLACLGHQVTFLERDQEWYAANRDVAQPEGACVYIYSSFEELSRRFERCVREADLVIVGSYVPEGCAVGDWVVSTAKGLSAFYDIDTPVTISKLRQGDEEYISKELIPRYGCYLSFAGGPSLRVLEQEFGAAAAKVLFCSVDPDVYSPMRMQPNWDLGYLGTYSDDRQPGLDCLMLSVAREWHEGRFAVAGSMYPDSIEWPQNVDRFVHLSQVDHVKFYCAQRFTLNVTRDAMKNAGYSPSVRLFEAAACGVPIISDWWDGLDEVFSIGEEILVAGRPQQSLRFLLEISEGDRMRMASAAREKVLALHTHKARARQLENYVRELA